MKTYKENELKFLMGYCKTEEMEMLSSFLADNNMEELETELGTSFSMFELFKLSEIYAGKHEPDRLRKIFTIGFGAGKTKTQDDFLQLLDQTFSDLSAGKPRNSEKVMGMRGFKREIEYQIKNPDDED